MVQVIASTDEWHAAHKASGSKPVVVDFFAEWCGPCKMISPKFYELAEANGDKLTFVKVDVDQCEQVAQICNITAMPTFQVWKDGQMVDTLVGANLDKLNQLVAKWSA